MARDRGSSLLLGRLGSRPAEERRPPIIPIATWRQLIRKKAMRIRGHEARSMSDRYDIQQDERDVEIAAQKLVRYLEEKGTAGQSRSTGQRERSG
jgi:hypothetical protein